MKPEYIYAVREYLPDVDMMSIIETLVYEDPVDAATAMAHLRADTHERIEKGMIDIPDWRRFELQCEEQDGKPNTEGLDVKTIMMR